MAEGTRTESTQGHWISVPKLIASVVAAVLAAILASFLGVTGTLVGTALVSVVATLGKDVTRRSIRQTHSYLKEQVNAAAGGSDESTDSDSADERRGFFSRIGSGSGRRLGWKAGAAVAAGVFVVSIGIVTVIEVAANAPLSHLVGGHGSSGGNTTVGQVFKGGSNSGNGSGSGSSGEGNSGGGSSGGGNSGGSGG